MTVLSASQLELYKLCPTRHFYKYILGRPDPSGDAAEAGTQVHALLESYLLNNVMPDLTLTWVGPRDGYEYQIGRIALAMIENLPPGGTVPEVEITLALEVGAHEYRGRVDARRRDEQGRLIVTDHKTTSNIRYAKTTEDLEEDIQAILYAKWAGEDVLLEWNFGQSKQKEATKKAPAHFPTKLVTLFLTKEQADERYKKFVEPVAAQVEASYKHRDIRRVQKNESACLKFPPNGCPFKGECLGKTLQIEKDRTMENGKKMTMVEMLRAKSLGTYTLDKSNPERAAAMAAMGQYLVEKGGGSVSNDVVEPERAAAVAADMKAIANAQSTQPTITSLGDLINAPNVVRTAAPVVADVVDTLPKKTRKKREPIQVLGQSGVEIVTYEPKISPSQREALAELSAESQELEKLSVKLVDGKPIRTLFLDCLPLTSPVVHAHILIAKAAETVCGDLQVLNIKLVEYGKGGGSLAAQLHHDILELEPGFDLCLNSRSVEGREVVQTLCSLSQNIVMAL